MSIYFKWIEWSSNQTVPEGPKQQEVQLAKVLFYKWPQMNQCIIAKMF